MESTIEAPAKPKCGHPTEAGHPCKVNVKNEGDRCKKHSPKESGLAEALPPARAKAPRPGPDTVIRYRVQYCANAAYQGAEPVKQPGRSGFLRELGGTTDHKGDNKGAIESAIDMLKFFNQRKVLRKKKVDRGREIEYVKTYPVNKALVWIETYHDGALVATGNPLKLSDLIPAEDDDGPDEETVSVDGTNLGIGRGNGEIDPEILAGLS